MDVREYLAKKGYQWKEQDRPTGKIAVMNCPFCGDMKEKFGVSLADGAFNCYRLNECGVKGSWHDLQRMLGDTPVRLDDDRMITYKPSKTYRDLSDLHGKKLSQPAIEWLEQKRGFKKALITKFRLAAHDDKTVMIPFFRDGKVVNVKYRSIIEKKMWQEKEAEPVLFNRDSCKGTQLIITEGEFDVIALAHYGLDAVSVPSGATDTRWIEHEWEYLQQFQSIYLAGDQDEAGQKSAEKIATRLGRWRCFRVELPHKDANDCLTNNIPHDEMLRYFAEAKDYQPASLSRVESFIDDVIRLFEDDKILHGVPTGWEALDRILRGWREEEMTVWSGRNGAGKSTILNQVMLHNIKTGIRNCIVSLEMPVVRLLRWMIIQYHGLSNPTAHMVREAGKALNDYVFFVNVVGEIKPEEVLNCFEYAARRFGVKHFFVDSLMRISIDPKNELAGQKDFCSRLLDFSKQHKAHIHLVAHPRKSKADDDIPGKVDVAGTGDITNLAHNVITISRPSEQSKEKMAEKAGDHFDALVMVKKNREWGDEGAVRMTFDSDIKLFTEQKEYFLNGKKEYL